MREEAKILINAIMECKEKIKDYEKNLAELGADIYEVGDYFKYELYDGCTIVGKIIRINGDELLLSTYDIDEGFTCDWMDYDDIPNDFIIISKEKFYNEIQQINEMIIRKIEEYK